MAEQVSDGDECNVSANDITAIDCGFATNVGRVRKINEDSLAVLPEFGLWCVADGMGGHSAGDFASGTIVEELASVGIAGSAQDQVERFKDRIARANAKIMAKAEELGTGVIGSTVAALMIYEDRFNCVWAGDSRVYLLRDRQLYQVSIDHTEVQELLARGQITPEEAKTWPRRNVITRAVGANPHLECQVVGDELQQGDTFLICSDGLTEHIEDFEIHEMLSQSEMSQQVKCDRLVEETLDRGAKDNVTVIILRATPKDVLEELTNLPLPDLRAGWV